MMLKVFQKVYYDVLAKKTKLLLKISSTLELYTQLIAQFLGFLPGKLWPSKVAIAGYFLIYWFLKVQSSI